MDPAHPVDPVIRVPGEKPGGKPGPIYFVDVRERPARLLERLVPWTRSDGSDIVPSPPIPQTLERRLGQLDMTDSQKHRFVVALNHLGYKVHARSGGVTVLVVTKHAPAADVIRPGDVIVRRTGAKPASVLAPRAALAAKRPGATVKIRFRRGGGCERRRSRPWPTLRTRAARSSASPRATTLRSSCRSRSKFDAGGVGGPSAGLAFALDILQELGRNVAHGKKVAATGELALDGAVGPIGGVKQKTLGAREAGVDVFLVPAGHNAREARRYAQGLPIVPVNELSTGVAGAGNVRARKLEEHIVFGNFESAGNCSVFSTDKP